MVDIIKIIFIKNMDKKESYQEKVSRVATTIENLLNAEGLRMDVVHQVFFRPTQSEGVSVKSEDQTSPEVAEVEEVSSDEGVK